MAQRKIEQPAALPKGQKTRKPNSSMCDESNLPPAKRVCTASARQSNKIEELVVFISACCVETAFKLHAQGSTEHKAALRVAQNPRVQALRDSESFKRHHRCEPNYGLDSGSLAGLEKALPCDDLARVKISITKVLICPQDGMLNDLEERYRELTGQSPWERAIRPKALLKAFRSIVLDDAYGTMRQTFFAAEAKRQGMLPARTLPLPWPTAKARENESGLWQKTLFVNYYVELCNTSAFETALAQFAGQETHEELILERTLFISSSFHRMLVAREFSFLFDNFPDDAGERMVTVGGGAAKTVRECAGKGYREGITYNKDELLEDLRALHSTCIGMLDQDLLKAVCPKGWMLDFTEHSCCEKRRHDDAAVRVLDDRQPRRERDQATVARRQEVRCRRLRSGPLGRECWRVLGFPELPSLAKQSCAADQK
jgi:hypothetical protein